MKSKTLLLLGALGTAGLTSAVAQSVYSVNAVGYVNKTCPVGFTMVANPLNAPTNTIGALIPNPPDGTTVYKWNGTTFTSSTADGGWSNPNLGLAPGEGVFIRVVGSPLTITFVGEVVQGTTTNSLPVGFSIRSSIVPQAATLDALGFPAGDGDTIYRYVGSGYVSSVYDGGWAGTPPSVGVAEAFWVRKVGSAAQWVRTFTVN